MSSGVLRDGMQVSICLHNAQDLRNSHADFTDTSRMPRVRCHARRVAKYRWGTHFLTSVPNLEFTGMDDKTTRLSTLKLPSELYSEITAKLEAPSNRPTLRSLALVNTTGAQRANVFYSGVCGTYMIYQRSRTLRYAETLTYASWGLYLPTQHGWVLLSAHTRRSN
jgi:hypothetical protein